MADPAKVLVDQIWREADGRVAKVALLNEILSRVSLTPKEKQLAIAALAASQPCNSAAVSIGKLDGTTIQLDIGLSDTIAALKLKISQIEGAPVARQEIHLTKPREEHAESASLLADDVRMEEIQSHLKSLALTVLPYISIEYPFSCPQRSPDCCLEGRHGGIYLCGKGCLRIRRNYI